jgi:hypothetical protein
VQALQIDQQLILVQTEQAEELVEEPLECFLFYDGQPAAPMNPSGAGSAGTAFTGGTGGGGIDKRGDW